MGSSNKSTGKDPIGDRTEAQKLGAFREHSMASSPVWVFGYGSLIWKTNFPYEDRVVGHVRGYTRRFWLGDVDHRGVPGAPGRVATLVENKDEATWGVAFKVHPSQVCSTMAYLSVREQGYTIHQVTFYPCDSAVMQPMIVLVYIGTETSPSFLGPAPEEHIARQVISTRGCSGSNTEYVLNLASSMREIAPEVHDEHLFTLEAKIKELLLSSTQHQKALDSVSATSEHQRLNRAPLSVS